MISEAKFNPAMSAMGRLLPYNERLGSARSKPSKTKNASCLFINDMPEQLTLTNSSNEVVLNFIEAMNAWEISCYERAQKVRGTDELESEWAKFHAELLSIHSLYLTPRKRVYVEQVTFQKPPRYDASKESVISSSIEGRTAVVQTKRVMVLGRGQFQYMLRLIGSSWRIDNLKKLVNETWKPWLF